MIGVGISGACGRMGRLAAAAVQAAGDMTLATLYAPGHSGEVVGSLAAHDEADRMGDCDVIVELTVPDVVMDNLRLWREVGAHVVVGTSGFDADRIAALRRMWEGAAGNCLVVPNFSVAAVLMMRMAELAAPHMAAVEIVEMHHQAKVDAPSGTAVATAGRIARSSPGIVAAGGSPARGVAVDGIPVHSVRLPGVMARQDVVFGGQGETLTIRHDTLDRSSYIPGLLASIRAVSSLAGVTVGLDGVLGL